MVGRTIAYKGGPIRVDSQAPPALLPAPREVFRGPTCCGIYLIPKTTGRYPNRSLLARYSCAISPFGERSTKGPEPI